MLASWATAKSVPGWSMPEGATRAWVQRQEQPRRLMARSKCLFGLSCIPLSQDGWEGKGRLSLPQCRHRDSAWLG